MGLNSSVWPVPEEAFEDMVKEMMDLAPGEEMPGYRRYGRNLRQAWRKDMVVTDKDDVPSNRIYERR
eukprot:3192462-Lingulodinium_polyedra.AAC.1